MTPQLDNILEKARLDQLQGQLLELRGMSKKRKTPKRYTVYILPCIAPSKQKNLMVVYMHKEYSTYSFFRRIEGGGGWNQPRPPPPVLAVQGRTIQHHLICAVEHLVVIKIMVTKGNLEGKGPHVVQEQHVCD